MTDVKLLEQQVQVLNSDLRRLAQDVAKHIADIHNVLGHYTKALEAMDARLDKLENMEEPTKTESGKEL